MLMFDLDVHNYHMLMFDLDVHYKHMHLPIFDEDILFLVY